MTVATLSLRDDFWEEFELEDEDITFLYEYLLEKEIPLTSEELTPLVVKQRISREKEVLEKNLLDGKDIYAPKEEYEVGQGLVFPALNWQKGEVIDVRAGENPELGEFQVIKVQFEEGIEREFASQIEEHILNEPLEKVQAESLDEAAVLEQNSDLLTEKIEQGLKDRPEFACVAGRWFPRALLLDINVGHLNLAEAVLDMNGGGPLSTKELIEQVEISPDVHPRLIEFSLDMALQEDIRFDEVGPAGIIAWYLHSMEPDGVRETPPYLQYSPVDYDKSPLTDEMLELECVLDDELSSFKESKSKPKDEVKICLIFPHWRAGTLPLSARIEHLFPTAYEAPRIRFVLIDGDTGERFPGWVVRKDRYVYGLRDWYESKGLFPGGSVRIRQGKEPGEIIVEADSSRATKNWMRTVLVGSDGEVVFATLKQIISADYNERMAIIVPDVAAIDEVWKHSKKKTLPLEEIVVDIVRELAKLNPQGHVHVAELYAAVNVIRRCPPGPLMSLLESRPWFAHVGDLHFKLDDAQGN
ncbi:MAG: hypothetical protein B6I38_04970 [Anaerolineaceae bacterium 4572_5.1]|nr:MAG: hypothetical protein B6I38_04970 [Anaerolineaceae bacterium 4572_5.1]